MIQSLIIEGITDELYGYGFIDGRKFSFPYVKPGDEVQFQTLGRGKRRFHKNLSIPEYESAVSGCKYFTKCGGCRARHIPYEEQFFYKSNSILNQFRDSFGVELSFVVPNKTEEYRNRMDFAVFPEATGLRQEGNFRRIVDIESCSLQSRKANEELFTLRGIFGSLPYNRKTGGGFLKYVTLRMGMNEELMTIFTFTKEFRLSEEEVSFKELVSRSSKADSIIFCYNRSQAEVSAVGESVVIRGRSFLLQNVRNRILKVPFDSFFQPNPSGFTPILDFISEELEGTRGRMIDLFCGTGFFSLIFGDRFSEVLGLDIVESSIQQAKMSAEALFPGKKMDFRSLDILSQKWNFSEFLQSGENSVAFLDPPRNGLGTSVIKFLMEVSFYRVFYVSCNPHSQLRDLESLHEKYKISRGLLTDPYPHTPHMESVVLLERRHESNTNL